MASWPARCQVGSGDLVDVRHWDQVQVGVAATPCAKLATPRPMLGDNRRPEDATYQGPHILYCLTDPHQFSGSRIRHRVDVAERHEQAVSGSEAADGGQ
jgi:hypothetical protein